MIFEGNDLWFTPKKLIIKGKHFSYSRQWVVGILLLSKVKNNLFLLLIFFV